MKLLKIHEKRGRRNAFENQKRECCCAFTGHRPEKVFGTEHRIIVELRKEILKAIDEGYRVFLSGMSRGVDIWAADIIIELRKYNKDLKLMCVIPFEGMEAKWSVDWKKHYQMVRRQADYIHIVSDRYSTDIYQKRNKWIVDHSSKLIAVFNNEPSGTANTIQYARTQSIAIQVIEVSL